MSQEVSTPSTAPARPASSDAECLHCGQTPPSLPQEVACGSCRGLRVISHRYRLLERLGEGGMGYVCSALDEQTGTRVAVKVVSLERARDWKAIDLFERGTRILESLQHSGVPRVHAFVRDDASRWYQVRDGYDGGSLQARVRSTARIDRKQVHFLLKDLLEIVLYLHARVPAVIHRDIKPSNILFRANDDWHPVLVDFDTAAANESSGTGTTIVVSPGYSAPEQLAGDSQPASDLYSVGMTMLFVLTQTSPTDLPRKQGRFDVEAALATLEPATRNVLSRLIQPDLASRYTTAREALADLAGRVPNASQLAAAPPKGSFLTTKLEFGGVSLFRITVGVLLGCIVGWMLLQTLGPTGVRLLLTVLFGGRGT